MATSPSTEVNLEDFLHGGTVVLSPDSATAAEGGIDATAAPAMLEPSDHIVTGGPVGHDDDSGGDDIDIGALDFGETMPSAAPSLRLERSQTDKPPSTAHVGAMLAAPASLGLPSPSEGGPHTSRASMPPRAPPASRPRSDSRRSLLQSIGGLFSRGRAGTAPDLDASVGRGIEPPALPLHATTIPAGIAGSRSPPSSKTSPRGKDISNRLGSAQFGSASHPDDGSSSDRLGLSRVEHLATLLNDALQDKIRAESEAGRLRHTLGSVRRLLRLVASTVATSADADGAATGEEAGDRSGSDDDDNGGTDEAGSVGGFCGRDDGPSRRSSTGRVSESSRATGVPSVREATEALVRLSTAERRGIPVAAVAADGSVEGAEESSATAQGRSRSSSTAAASLLGDTAIEVPSRLEGSAARAAVHLSTCLQTLESQLLEAKLQLADMSFEAESAHSHAKKQWEKDLAEAKSSASSLSSDIDEARSRVAEAEREAEALRAENAELRVDVARLRMNTQRGVPAGPASAVRGSGAPSSAYRLGRAESSEDEFSPRVSADGSVASPRFGSSRSLLGASGLTPRSVDAGGADESTLVTPKKVSAASGIDSSVARASVGAATMPPTSAARPAQSLSQLLAGSSAVEGGDEVIAAAEALRHSVVMSQPPSARASPSASPSGPNRGDASDTIATASDEQVDGRSSSSTQPPSSHEGDSELSPARPELSRLRSPPSAAGGFGVTSTSTPLGARALLPTHQSFRVWDTGRFSASRATIPPMVEGATPVAETDEHDSDADDAPKPGSAEKDRALEAAVRDSRSGSGGASVTGLGDDGPSPAPSSRSSRPRSRLARFTGSDEPAVTNTSSPKLIAGTAVHKGLGSPSRAGVAASRAVTVSRLSGIEDDPWTLVDRAIATVPLFTKFDQRERSLVISSLQHVKYDDGELVYRRGDHEPDAFFIVVSGTIVLLEPLFHTVPAASQSLAASASAGKPVTGKRSAEQTKPGQRLTPAQWFVGSGTGDRTAVSRGSSACMRLPGGALGQLLQWFEGTRRMKALAGSSQALSSRRPGQSVLQQADSGGPEGDSLTQEASPATSPSNVIAHSASSAIVAAARLKRRLHRKRSSRRTVLRSDDDSATSHAESHQRLMMVREAVAGVSTLAAYSAAVRGMLGMGRPIVLNLPEGRFQGEAGAVKAALAAFAQANLATDTLQQALKPVGAPGADDTMDGRSGDAAMTRLADARTAASLALRQSRETASLAVAHCWPVNLHDLCQAVRDLSREASIIVNGVRVNLRSREAIAGLVLVLTAAVTGSADFLPGLIATAEAEAAVAAAIESPQSRASRLAAAEAKALRDAEHDDDEEAEEDEGGPLSEEELVQLVARQAVDLRADIELAATAAASSGRSGIRRRRLAHADGAARMVSDILVAATRTHSGGDALDVVFGTLMAPGLVTVAAEPAGSSECEILTAGESAVRVISTNSFRLMGVSSFTSSLAGLGGVGDLAGTRQGFANGLSVSGLGTMEQLLAAGPSSSSSSTGIAAGGGGRVTPGLIGIVRTTMEERLEYVSESEIGRAHSLPHRMKVILERGLVETTRSVPSSHTADGDAAPLGDQGLGVASAAPGTTSQTPRAGSGVGLPRASPGADKSQFKSAGGIIAARNSTSSASPPESGSTISRGHRTRGSSMLGPAELELQVTRSGSHGHHHGMDMPLSPLSSAAGDLSAAMTPSSLGSPDDRRGTAAIKARIRGVGSSGPGEMEADLLTPALEVKAHKSIGSRMRKFLGIGSKPDSSSTAEGDSSPTAARLGEAQRTGDWDAVLGSGGAGETPVQRRTSWSLGGMRGVGRSASSASEASASPDSALPTASGSIDVDGDVEEEEDEEDEEAVELGRLLATVIDAATHGSVTSLLRGVTRSPLRAVRVTRTLRISFVDKEQAAASKPPV